MSQSLDTPVIGFAAYSGTGKTTLLKKLIPILRDNGLRLALIKHSHHDFEIDHPGKDSYELRQAGLDQTLITSAYRSALMRENRTMQEPKLEYALAQLDLSCIDLVLVEGFRTHPLLPKIEIHRSALDKPLLHHDHDNFIAIVSDRAVASPLPWYRIDDVAGICTFILDWRLQQKHVSAIDFG